MKPSIFLKNVTQRVALRGALFLVILFLSSCSESKVSAVSKSANQEKLLTFYAKQIIIPSYANLDSLSQNLKIILGDYKETTDSTNLEKLRSEILKTWESWVEVESFEFGPAMKLMARQNLNTFPVDTAKIMTHLKAEDYDFSTISAYKVKGFSALDFLFFSKSNDETNRLFNDSLLGLKSFNYADTLISDITLMAQSIMQSWNKSGADYGTQFIESQGTAMGASLSELVNQFNYDYETLGKWARVGIPLGKPLITPYPELIEAPFSKHSKALLVAQISSLLNIFNGYKIQNSSAYALSHYLNDIDAKYLKESLSTKITKEFEILMNLIEVLPEDFAVALKENTDEMNAVYEQFQRVVILIKSDLPSALSVSINYQDNDGD